SMKQVEQLRSLGMELISDGEYGYYLAVKETFSENDPSWSIYLHELLDRAEQAPRAQETYTRILVEERMFARLFAYVREAPYRVESFYGVLLPHYPEEVKELFILYIELRADRARDRRDYADVARIIRLLQQVGGGKEAYAVIKQLLLKFPRKPAMREELEKVAF